MYSNFLDKSYIKYTIIIEETGFNLFQKIPEKYMPACIINWMDKYTSKRLTELKQQITHSKWQTMELEKAVENIHNRQ